MIALLVLVVIVAGIAGLLLQFSLESRVARIERGLGCLCCDVTRASSREQLALLPPAYVIRDPKLERRELERGLRRSLLTRLL